jgi:hypothetical protein
MGGGRVSSLAAAVAVWLAALGLAQVPGAAQREATQPSTSLKRPHFQTSDNCLACHNSLTAPSGEDVSIGSAWRGSMMANSSRDPYWQASVRRETIDHPSRKAAIEDECSTCHMPMARAMARAAGAHGEVFTHLPTGRDRSDAGRLAADGVSCTLCHQISRERFGTPESFTGGFVVDAAPQSGPAIFGPFRIDAGRTRIMHSAAGVTPTEATHIQQSELCATCHTLYTKALGPNGEVTASLPEQVPYLEWQHSAFRTERSCQSCHMPEVSEPTPVSSVLGEPRAGLSRHAFIGGNFFMLRMLNRYRTELGVEALPVELESTARATTLQLETGTAAVSLAGARASGGLLDLDVAVRNLTGHKFPTGYPARRAWLHVVVRDRDGRAVFESGAMASSGAIDGNDNDVDGSRFEPHHDEIRSAADVQIYESMMVDAAGAVTTGLLTGTRFVKDNRLLPRGFDKATASADIAVRGEASSDDDFGADGDRVRYVVDVRRTTGPLQVTVELRYQPIAFRWAKNLTPYDANEPRRFVSYFDAMSSQSSIVVGTASLQVQ